MAKQEHIKKMWLIRKLYGSGNLQGKGGILPPTDPRLLDLTDEQIELDLLLYIEDNPDIKKRSDAYKDTEYERAMREELEYAEEAPTQAGPGPVNDWEDAPID